MLKRVKRRIKEAYTLFPSVQESKKRTTNHYSLSIIQSAFPTNNFLPLTTWAPSPTGLLHLLNHITINEPPLIVEFGSGFSTVIIGKLIKKNKLKSRLISFDNDSNWSDKVNSWLLTEEINANITSSYFAELKQELIYKNQSIFWYNTEKVKSVLQDTVPDLLIVDGPHGSYKNARAGALLFFQKQIEKQSLSYFYDDTDREEEFEIVNTIGANNNHFLDYTFGGKILQYGSIPISVMK